MPPCEIDLVVLISNYLPDQQESMLRYASLLEKSLKHHHLLVKVIRPKVYVGRFFKTSRLSKWLGYIDKFIIFPIKLVLTILYLRLKKKHAIYHICDHSNAMYIPYLKKQKHVITCHDTFAIESALFGNDLQQTGFTGKIFQHLILRGLKKAKHLICVSEKSQSDFLKVIGPQVHSTYIPNALNPAYLQQANLFNEDRISSNKPYFIHVGGNQWYKNRLGVLKIFKELIGMDGFNSHQLVMVGKPWTDEMQTFIQQHHLQDSVVMKTGIDDITLKQFYQHSQGLIFPSLAEGFGWPIIEAQACGCLVITSDLSPMSDIAQGSAILIPASDPPLSAKIISEAFPQRLSYIKKGLYNAQQYDSKIVTAKIIQLYCDIKISEEGLCLK